MTANTDNNDTDPIANLAAQAMAADDTDTDNQPPSRTPTVTEKQAAMIHRGQARMAYRMATLYRDKLMHVHDVGWYYWDGKRYALDDRGAAKKAVLATIRQALSESVNLDDDSKKLLREDARRCESNGAVEGVLAIAASLEPFAYTVDDLDADPYLFNCANATLDLRTMNTHPHTPKDRITKVANAAYDPKALGPEWDKFIYRVLPNENVRNFLQRYVGLALCGRVLEHRLAILTGIGRNGKGVFYGAVLKAMGDYATVPDPELFTHRENAHPTGQMDLMGRRFVVVSESDKDRRLSEATVKRLTGGDRIKAHYMRRDFVEFEPSHTAALVTNHLPKVSGDDPALWGRLRVIPFDVVIPEKEQDAKLPEKLELESDAVLTWCIQGWKDYDRDGLAEPEEVTAATHAYQQDSNAIGRFLEDQCYRGDALQVKKSDVWQRWLKWSDIEGEEKISQKALGLALVRAGIGEARTAGARVWKGIALKENELDDEDDEDRRYGRFQ